MSLSAMLFGQNSAIHKITNIIGLGIPGLLHKAFMPGDPKMAPQTLGELSQQTAKEGDPRPIVYGIGRPIGGNIMYMSQPVKRMVKTYVGKAGGKGGGKKKKQYQDVEHVYRYYAIRVCEGPITGFRRIWRNGALVYDARKGSEWGAKNNHLFFQNYRLYTGSWDQMPDSMLQSRWGMDIPAHRGTAYLVADNEDLTDFGGAIPQWQFEVVRSEGFYLTSRPYALEDEPSSGAFAVSVKESPSTNIVEQSGTTGVALLGGQSSGTWKQSPIPEEMNATGGVDRIVMTRTARYSSMDAGHEEMNATGGVHRIVMTRTTRYSDYTVEPQEMNATGGVDRIVMTRTSSGGDPHWKNVVALLHFDENFQDEIDGITWSNLGNNSQTGIDKINPIVGNGSLFVNSGTVGGISRTPVFTAVNDDFTIEVLVEFTSLLSGSPSPYPRQAIWDFSDARNRYDYYLGKRDDGTLVFDLRGCKISSADDTYLQRSYIPPSPIEVGKKYHIAHTYTGNRHRFFLNGELVLSLEYPRGMPLLPQVNVIGARPSSTSDFMWASKAKYDEFRITKGVARYTENFTPPDKPFPKKK